jgi:adenylate kinase family enzyme
MLAMRKVAVFGNAGAGKSALARRLAELTGLPLYPLDIIQFRGGYRPAEKDGGKVPQEEYLQIHADLLKQDRWIIDGYGTVASSWERFDAADTLVYIDLPVLTHYLWVTKRLVKGIFRNPPGWPENTPVLSSTLDSYKVVWLCHRRLTPKYRQLVADASPAKRVHHLRSPAEIEAFLQAVRQEHEST